ncbi:MAG TPA: hypothetical protein VGM18_01035 [Candidatus Sulfotelmatobacter sp.]|jgi:hypothetical protein
MNRKWLGKWIGVIGLMGVSTWLLSLNSCARNQQLVGITVSPSTFTFLTPDPTLQAGFSAVGTYIHPAENKDITSIVTWGNDIPQLITLNGGAVSPTGLGCGVANISASYDKGTGPSGNLVSGTATVTVNNPLISYCPGGTTSPILAVVIQPNTATGDSITSSPAGINCPATTCGAPFPTGSVVSLTASPAANFVSWGAPCAGSTSTTCDVVLSASTTVTATFQ